MAYVYEFPRPAVTVDIAVFRSRRGGDEVLLIQRGKPPFVGQWALPGGFVEIEEDLPDAARRELAEETGIEIERLIQVGAYGRPGRDPRGRTISIAYVGRADAHDSLSAGDDAADAAWHLLDALPALPFDHEEIIRDARAALADGG